MNDYSRDETEVGAFGTPTGPRFGGVAYRFVPHGASAAEMAAAMRGAFCEAAGLPPCIGGYRDPGDFSRDETEIGSLESEAFGESDFGGFFDKILGKATGKKKLEAKLNANLAGQLKAQGQSPAQVANAMALMKRAQAKPITAKDIGKGMIQTAKIGAAVAAFVVPGGAIAGGAALAGLTAGSKLLSTGKQVVSTVKGVQSTVNTARAAIQHPTAALGGLVAADQLVAAGERGVASAKATLANTQRLAAAGHVDAQHGLQLIGMASSLRARSAVPKGTPQPVSAAGNAALVSFLANRRPVVVARPVAAAPLAPRPPVVPARAPIMPVLPPRPPIAVAARPVVPPVLPARAPVAAPAAPAAIGWFVDDRGLVTRLRAGQVLAGHGGWRVTSGAVQRFFG